MISRMDLPSISCSGYANISSAAGFHDVMIPSSVLLIIASCDDLTIADRRKSVEFIDDAVFEYENPPVKCSSFDPRPPPDVNSRAWRSWLQPLLVSPSC